MTTLSMPERILHFDILELIGAGPNGTVFRAWDTKEERIVALKLIPKKICCDERFQHYVEHYLLELLRVPHPNLCTLFAIERCEDGIVIVEEFVERTSLRAAVLSNDKVSESAVLTILAQAASALSSLHRVEIEHGNLHARNFLYSTDGRVKLTDACLRSGIEMEKHVSESGFEPIIDHVGDLSDLGKIIYRATTNSDWEGPGIPDPTSLTKYGLHNDTALILCQLLSQDPLENFATASDLLVSVKAVMSFHEQDPGHELELQPRRRDASPRQYLMMSVLVGLLIVLWLVIASR